MTHYLKLFLRHFVRNKGFSIINVAGLSMGMAVSILIFLYVFHELTYDNFIENADNKYRIHTIFELPNDQFIGDRSNGEMAGRVMQDIPDAINAVCMNKENPYVSYGEKLFKEDKGDIYFCGTGVVDFFNLEIIAGNPETVFAKPFSIIMSEDKAVKYFGDEDPIGKTLTMEDAFAFKVSGIFRNLPENTHFRPGMIMPMEAYLKIYNLTSLQHMGNSFVTYIELNENTDIEGLCRKLEETTYLFMPPEVIESMGLKITHFLLPIKKIHLYGNSSFFDNKKTSSRMLYIYIFSAIAIFILLLACINFMNLSTAKYSNRAREVGLRKITGASRGTLIRQFLGESVLTSFIALFTALVIAELLLPIFNTLIDKNLSLSFSMNFRILAGLVVLGLSVGILAGSYPAFFLTSFKPLEVIRGKFRAGASGKMLRWPLVIFQFVIALVLTTCTIIIYSQMDFIKSKDLGFSKENLLMIKLNNSDIQRTRESFKNDLAKIPGVVSASISNDKPGISTSWYGDYEFEDHEEEEFPVFATVFIDDDFINTLGLTIVKGRNLSQEFGTDSLSALINESMAKLLGWENPVGKTYTDINHNRSHTKYTVVGVIGDFHMESLHKEIKPMLFRKDVQKRYCLIKINPENSDQTKAAIEMAWQKFSPSKPIGYQYLSESFDLEYRSERKFATIIVYFTLIAILISCLGIIGLVSYLTASRTREIGVRKVLGSTTIDILRLISSDFMKMIGIALLISIPLGWYIMSRWLENFAYSVKISAWMFVITGIVAIIIALISTSVQAIRAALQNPVESLRYE